MARCIRLCALAAVTLTTLSFSVKAWAWGDRGHRVVNLSAIDLMSSPGASFFKTNSESLATLSLTPDKAWKQGHFQQERALHFFQLDRFREARLPDSFERMTLPAVLRSVDMAFINENGSAPWRSSDIYHRLVAALRANDWVKSLQMAGVLGHYIGDVSQPMHVTSDYDGQSIGRTGIHIYFEVDLMNTVPEENLVNACVNTGGNLRHADESTNEVANSDSETLIRSYAYDESTKALDALDGILGLFHRNSQDEAGLKTYFAPRMGSAAATLARIWDRAFQEAGVTGQMLPRNRLQVRDPEWFDLERSSNNRQNSH